MLKKYLCIVLAIILVLTLCAVTAYAAAAREQIVYRAAKLTKSGDGRLGVYFAIASKGDMDALGATTVTIERKDGDKWTAEYVFSAENTPELQAGGVDYYDLVLEYRPEQCDSEYRAVVEFVARSPLSVSTGAVKTAPVTTNPPDSANEYTVVMKTTLYAAPSDTSEEIITVKAGAHVTKISDVNTEWSKVELDGAIGYIPSSYVYLTSACYKVDVDRIDAPFWETPEMIVALNYLPNGSFVICSGNENVNGLVECTFVGVPTAYLIKYPILYKHRLGQIGYMPYSSLIAS